MPTFEDVAHVAAAWPGVTVDTWYGTPGLKVGGKGFCRTWSEREHDRNDVHDTEVLVVMCDIDEKDALIEASGGMAFSTPHYEGHGAMLVRLADVSADELADFLEDSYRIKASSRLLEQFDQSGPSA